MDDFAELDELDLPEVPDDLALPSGELLPDPFDDPDLNDDGALDVPPVTDF